MTNESNSNEPLHKNDIDQFTEAFKLVTYPPMLMNNLKGNIDGLTRIQQHRLLNLKGLLDAFQHTSTHLHFIVTHIYTTYPNIFCLEIKNDLNEISTLIAAEYTPLSNNAPSQNINNKIYALIGKLTSLLNLYVEHQRMINNSANSPYQQQIAQQTTQPQPIQSQPPSYLQYQPATWENTSNMFPSSTIGLAQLKQQFANDLEVKQKEQKSGQTKQSYRKNLWQ